MLCVDKDTLTILSVIQVRDLEEACLYSGEKILSAVNGDDVLFYIGSNKDFNIMADDYFIDKKNISYVLGLKISLSKFSKNDLDSMGRNNNNNEIKNLDNIRISLALKNETPYPPCRGVIFCTTLYGIVFEWEHHNLLIYAKESDCTGWTQDKDEFDTHISLCEDVVPLHEFLKSDAYINNLRKVKILP